MTGACRGRPRLLFEAARGYKSFEETTFGGGTEALDGEGCVHYLYEERVEEVERAGLS